MRFFLLLTAFFSLAAAAQNNLPAVGAWREHLPYGSALAVAATDTKIFCATPYSLFSVAPESGEIRRFSKVSGLSETGLSTIAYDGGLKKLVVAYSNGNVDVLGENNIKNIPDLKRATIAGNKTIYQVHPTATYCYLATGLGVVVLDLIKSEIRDTWFLGDGGSPVKINAVAQTDSFFYAATDGGLKKLTNGVDGADFRQWQTLTTMPCTGVVNLQNQIIAVQHDTLFTAQYGGLKKWYADGWPVVSIAISENNLLVCERTANGDSRVVILDQTGAVQRIVQQPGVISFPKMGILKSGVPWIADLYGGLSSWSGSDATSYKPNAPEDIATGALAAANGVVYAAAGSVNEAWNYQYNGNGIYKLQDGQWTSFNRFHNPELDSLLDFITVAIDPRDGSVWGGSFGGGLLHIKGDHTFEIFKQQSPIGPTLGDPGSYRVSGLAFDTHHNLWIANYGAAQNLHVLQNNGTWQSFSVPFTLVENEVAQLVIDDADQKWIIAPKGTGVLVFNDGGTLDNTSDDNWLLLKAGAGSGNLPSSNVLSLAKDKDGFMWIGTADGAGFVPCAADVFRGTCPTVLPVLKAGGFNGYLLKGEAVQSIAVDGANQKWMATKNGVWLLNADGDNVLQHFTETNSSLLSNDVRSIAIDGQSGEVFFATARGICSFRGAATEAADEVPLLVFPNPVPPGYGGTIAVKGLPEGSIVKFTELNGRLVYATKALGGQAVWNGHDYTGRSVATGVYLVLVTNETHTQTRTGKLVFLSK